LTHHLLRLVESIILPFLPPHFFSLSFYSVPNVALIPYPASSHSPCIRILHMFPKCNAPAFYELRSARGYFFCQFPHGLGITIQRPRFVLSMCIFFYLAKVKCPLPFLAGTHLGPRSSLPSIGTSSLPYPSEKGWQGPFSSPGNYFRTHVLIPPTLC